MSHRRSVERGLGREEDLLQVVEGTVRQRHHELGILAAAAWRSLSVSWLLANTTAAAFRRAAERLKKGDRDVRFPRGSSPTPSAFRRRLA